MSWFDEIKNLSPPGEGDAAEAKRKGSACTEDEVHDEFSAAGQIPQNLHDLLNGFLASE